MIVFKLKSLSIFEPHLHLLSQSERLLTGRLQLRFNFGFLKRVTLLRQALVFLSLQELILAEALLAI